MLFPGIFSLEEFFCWKYLKFHACSQHTKIKVNSIKKWSVMDIILGFLLRCGALIVIKCLKHLFVFIFAARVFYFGMWFVLWFHQQFSYRMSQKIHLKFICKSRCIAWIKKTQQLKTKTYRIKTWKKTMDFTHFPHSVACSKWNFKAY